MTLSKEAREARNAYARELYARDPEKRKEYNRQYWERRAQKMTEINQSAKVVDKYAKVADNVK